jgi:hypothetical protein
MVESGKDDRNRPALQQALAAGKVYGATLVITKLDRLSRDPHFLLGLQKAGVKLVAADLPEANEMVVGMMALVAQPSHDQRAYQGGATGGQGSRQTPWAAEGAQDPVRSGDTCAWFGCQRGQRSGLRRALASRSR